MEINLSDEELENRIAYFENIGDENLKKDFLIRGQSAFINFRFSFAPNCFDGSLDFPNVVKNMILLLSYFEPNEQELINRLKAENYFEILQDKPAKAKLLQLALRWEKVFIDLGNAEVNKYFLRNSRSNPALYDFIYSPQNFLIGDEIHHVSAYNNVVTVYASFTKEEFYLKMKQYDNDFEKFFFFLYIYFYNFIIYDKKFQFVVLITIFLLLL
jgi:hypothetical protein